MSTTSNPEDAVDWSSLVLEIMEHEGVPVNPTRLKNLVCKADLGTPIGYYVIKLRVQDAVAELIARGDVAMFQAGKYEHKRFGLTKTEPHFGYTRVPTSHHILKKVKAHT